MSLSTSWQAQFVVRQALWGNVLMAVSRQGQATAYWNTGHVTAKVGVVQWADAVASHRGIHGGFVDVY